MKIIQKKRLLIGVIIAVIGGIMLFSLNHKAQLEKQVELERNREYEVSLVNALKNSYEGIEEIDILSSRFLPEKPGGWRARIRLTFTDGVTVEYGVNHSLEEKVNRMGDGSDFIFEKLSAHFGQTEGDIKVIYSDGEESIE